MTEIILINHPDEYKAAAHLFQLYADWLAIDLCFQGFEQELQSLEAMYGPPHGGILLCRHEEEWIGCVAVRPINATVAELKRMYVLPDFQGMGLGRKLLISALNLAKDLGYQSIRLDTLDHMTTAINLYQSAGFREVPAYYHNPEKGAVYFEKSLLYDHNLG